ncbi:MAG: deoxyribonuclease IV [Acidimicrobiia bacterium]
MKNRFRFHKAQSDLLGAHVSIKGGVHTIFERGTAIEAAALALFSRNQFQWGCKPLTVEDLRLFKAGRRKTGTLPVLIHTQYLINLASTNSEFHRKSLAAMAVELARAEQLGVHAVVLHPGAHMGAGVKKGLDGIARSFDLIHQALPDCKVVTLLETAAGQGSCLGCSFEELGQILALVDDPSRLGVCVDTCHIFASGYDIRTRHGYERTIDQLERYVGLDNVGAFHLNDSKKPLGSRVDRHEHIGEGQIGRDGFAFLLNDPRFHGIPKVLETPKNKDLSWDIKNLRMLRSLLNAAPARRAQARKKKVA